MFRPTKPVRARRHRVARQCCRASHGGVAAVTNSVCAKPRSPAPLLRRRAAGCRPARCRARGCGWTRVALRVARAGPSRLRFAVTLFRSRARSVRRPRPARCAARRGAAAQSATGVSPPLSVTKPLRSRFATPCSALARRAVVSSAWRVGRPACGCVRCVCSPVPCSAFATTARAHVPSPLSRSWRTPPVRASQWQCPTSR